MAIKIISNKDIPQKAMAKLKDFGIVLPFETSKITYTAISNHPDVFLCQCDNQLILAPNTPIKFQRLLSDNNIYYELGDNNVGNIYPQTAKYNAVITDKYLIHNLKITDSKILDICTNKNAIHINQAYARCNLLPLKDNSFITSDKGIYNNLTHEKLNILFVKPNGIVLPNYNYGFFGGACGIHENNIWILGSLNNYNEGKKVADFLNNLGYNIIELFDGPLYDCGSLFIIP